MIPSRNDALADQMKPNLLCMLCTLCPCLFRFELSVLQARFEEGYINEGDPSILRFLIASRDEVSANQLRDDLLSMLVAGHETTGSVLTWTLYLLAKNPDKMRKVSALICCIQDVQQYFLICVKSQCASVVCGHES